MLEGCWIRELPDGGREFVLEETALSFIRIDHQSRLQFGRTEVMIGSPFVLEMDGVVHHLSPQRWDALGPLVALYPGSVRWLWTSPEGELTLVFHHRGGPDRVPRPLEHGVVGGERLRRPDRAEPGLYPRRHEASGPQAERSSGCRAATMARMPSRHATLVPPTSWCIRVRSIWTLSMVSRVGANRAGSPVSSEK